ncbi:MAG TPA: hypothetical protein VKB84_05610, partial [Candidatus Binataceae bacterium]|nr:hypothetical protein [Candidatus Binataceae bacterium]
MARLAVPTASHRHQELVFACEFHRAANVVCRRAHGDEGGLSEYCAIMDPARGVILGIAGKNYPAREAALEFADSG